MRIGLNLLYLIPNVVGGTETYARGLLSGLAAVGSEAEFFVYVNRSAAHWPMPDAPNMRRIVCPLDGRNRSRRYAYEQLVLPAVLRRDRVDLVHSLGYTTPAWTSCPSVVTVHDLNFRAVPMPWRRRLALEAFVRLGIRRARRVIAVSEFTRAEIVRVLGGRPERIRVIHSAAGASDATARPPQQDDRRYILAFGSGHAHKNMSQLLAAFAQVRHSGLDHRLVIVGRLAPGETTALAGRYANDVEVTGYLPPAQWDAVFRGASMLVFPSRYEGFGLPLLEAMQRDVAVVCSRRASLPEVAGDAALYFDPDDIADIAGAIIRAADPECARELARRGRARVAMFDWNRTARQALDVYRAALRETAPSAARAEMSR